MVLPNSADAAIMSSPWGEETGEGGRFTNVSFSLPLIFPQFSGRSHIVLHNPSIH
jgi:hypothetical protein